MLYIIKYRINIINSNTIDWDKFQKIAENIADENPQTSQVAIENYTSIKHIEDLEEYKKKINS